MTHPQSSADELCHQLSCQAFERSHLVWIHTVWRDVVERERAAIVVLARAIETIREQEAGV